MDSLAVLKRALAEDAHYVASQLLGAPNPAHSSRNEVRFGRKGSLSVLTGGPKKGCYYDYQEGVGGHLLDLIQRRLNVTFPDAVLAAQRLVGAVSEAHFAAADVVEKPARAREADNNKRAALQLWEHSVPLRGTIAERYLAIRGIDALPQGVEKALRFHPAARFGTDCLPTLVALFRDIVTNEPCGVHRTALTQNGEKIDRKCLGRKRGAAIKLTANEEVDYGIAVGEGIETCLSGMMLGFRPAWALGDAGELGRLPVLPGIDGLTIFVDHDSTGQTQSARCRERWRAAGRDVVEVTTTEAGADLNDLVRARG